VTAQRWPLLPALQTDLQTAVGVLSLSALQRTWLLRAWTALRARSGTARSCSPDVAVCVLPQQPVYDVSNVTVKHLRSDGCSTAC
jgi:hypothetical protein